MWRTLGQEFGPVEITALNELLKSGTISPDDEVCRGESENWQRVATVPELQKFCTPNLSREVSTEKSPEAIKKSSATTSVAPVKPISSPPESKPLATEVISTQHQAVPPKSVQSPVTVIPQVQATRRPLPPLPTDSTRVTTFALVGIVLACILGVVGIRYYIMRPLVIPLVWHKRPIDCIAFSPDGRWIATGGDDNALCLWSASDGTLRRTIQGHQGHIMAVAFSPDSQRVITGAQDNTAKVWDVERGVEVFTLHGHKKRVDGAAFSPDGTLFATGSWDESVRIWEASTGKLVRDFKTQLVNCLCFSPDSKTIATCSWDWTVRTYDVATGKQRRAFVGHGNGIHSVAFRPDGQQLVSASEDRTIRIWNVETGKQVLKLEGHAGPAYDALFTPDGKRVISCGKDQTIKVWNLEIAMESKTLTKHPGDVRCVACSPDGRTIASGGAEATSLLWKRYLP
ncbi:MAG: GYF domain-containing protein [Planctomycetota bacterium]